MVNQGACSALKDEYAFVECMLYRVNVLEGQMFNR